jgi:hypothetical protein
VDLPVQFALLIAHGLQLAQYTIPNASLLPAVKAAVNILSARMPMLGSTRRIVDLYEQRFVPQLVQSPEGIVPLYNPVVIARAPSGKIIVQEGVSGQVSVLAETGQLYNHIYLPIVGIDK